MKQRQYWKVDGGAERIRLGPAWLVSAMFKARSDVSRPSAAMLQTRMNSFQIELLDTCAGGQLVQFWARKLHAGDSCSGPDCAAASAWRGLVTLLPRPVLLSKTHCLSRSVQCSERAQHTDRSDRRRNSTRVPDSAAESVPWARGAMQQLVVASGREARQTSSLCERRRADDLRADSQSTQVWWKV
jgi:hypothetical protein